ncbi:MAG: SDR family oxidoreductase [Carbonactinosporaceae bacterium]
MTMSTDVPSAPVAIVTGAGRNIGRSIALELAAWGADVVIIVRSNRAEAEHVAAEVRALGRRARVAIADVRDEQAVTSIADDALGLGRPTVLVNNAAVRPEAPFLELTRSDWQDVTSVVLDGAFVCAQAVLPHMLEAGWGRIVNIAGLTGQTGASHRAHVVAAKAGLIGLTKALALEYAAHNITVNAVSPGKIDTTRVDGPPRHYADRQTPVGRPGRPREVAAMVRYLVSDKAAFITGQIMNVNGGLLT